MSELELFLSLQTDGTAHAGFTSTECVVSHACYYHMTFMSVGGRQHIVMTSARIL